MSKILTSRVAGRSLLTIAAQAVSALRLLCHGNVKAPQDGREGWNKTGGFAAHPGAAAGH